MELIVKFGVAPGIVLFSLSKMIPQIIESWNGARVGTAETGARVDTIDLLTKRVTDLEAGQDALRAKLEEERDKRVEAEDLVDKLQRRVSALEAQIRALGATPVGVQP